MAGGSRRSGRPALIVAGMMAAVGAIVGGWAGIRVVVRGAQLARGAIRFGFAVATLRLYRRCADCKGLIRGDACVCRHCGYRG